MRIAHALFAIGLAAAPLAFGCSLLVSFEDRASCDGGLCADASGVDGGGADAAPDAPAPVEAGSDGPYAPCQGFTGRFCGTDHLHGYRGPPGDLVTCDGGAIVGVLGCDAGCISMPDPFPDTCNGCSGKADGTYCGRDFPGFPHGAGGDDDMLVGCQSGNNDTLFACPHGCKSSGGASSCYP